MAAELNLERLRQEVDWWLGRHEDRAKAIHSLAQDAGCSTSLIHKLTSGSHIHMTIGMADRILISMGLSWEGTWFTDAPPVIHSSYDADGNREHLVCEDCGCDIGEGNYRPLDLMRGTLGQRRFRLVDLCRRCAGEALRQRAMRGSVMENGKKRALRTKERVPPKRGGRPRLLTDHELRQAHLVYESTTLSRREIATRLWEAKGNGTFGGYQCALLQGWRRLDLPLRDLGLQLAMSVHGTDGTKSRNWKKQCRHTLKDGRRCTQYVRIMRTETSSAPADDGLCFEHSRQLARLAA
jgi:hypothetical protein